MAEKRSAMDVLMKNARAKHAADKAAGKGPKGSSEPSSKKAKVRDDAKAEAKVEDVNDEATAAKSAGKNPKASSGPSSKKAKVRDDPKAEAKVDDVNDEATAAKSAGKGPTASSGPSSKKAKVRDDAKAEAKVEDVNGEATATKSAGKGPKASSGPSSKKVKVRDDAKAEAKVEDVNYEATAAKSAGEGSKAASEPSSRKVKVGDDAKAEAKVEDVNDEANATKSAGKGPKASSEPSSQKVKVGEDAKAEAEDVNDEATVLDSAAEAKEDVPPPPGVKKSGVDKVTAELLKKQADFDPKKAAFWKDGEPVPFIFLAQALDLIANETRRLVITEILCNVFRTVIATTPKDLLSVVYLSANKVAPAHEGIELGIGDATIIRTLAEAYGSKEDKIKSQLKTLGDLGLVAKASRSTQRLMQQPQPLMCAKVLEAFRFIAQESGTQSQDKKRGRMKALLVAGTDCEPQYLVRLLQAKMRIGFSDKTAVVSLGHAAVLSENPPVPAAKLQARLEDAGNIMKRTYSVLPILDRIVPALLDSGIQKLPEVCHFTVGIPVGPMLAKPTKGVSEVLDRFQELQFTCEYKYDGERAQIHYMEDGSVEIYSRNAERNTGKFPDVIDLVKRMKKPELKSFVVDAEVVAYDNDSKKILPFQILATRARKGVISSDIKVKVCLYVFDMLSINGRDLLNEQLIVRREELYKSFEEQEGEFQFATATNSRELDVMQQFLDKAVAHSCEGLIVKTLDTEATYEPTKRSNKWLKLKKDYMDSIGDSLDLVPIGGFFGQGKRLGFYGSFLLACYDEGSEEYQSICKIGTGFSEQQLEQRSTSLRENVIDKPRPYYRYGEKTKVDVWFDPVEVWEVKAADLTISPSHRAGNGLVDPTKGISLRFPRLLKVREDKKPEEATTAEQVAEMYRAQKINHQVGNADDDDE